MDITHIRRARLKAWVEKNGIPQREKSLFSQLKGTGSFGEKVARRLEIKYKMGLGFLDTPEGIEYVEPPDATLDSPPEANLREPHYAWLSDEEMRLVTLYRTTSALGQQEIMEEAEASERVIPSPSLVRNQA